MGEDRGAGSRGEQQQEGYGKLERKGRRWESKRMGSRRIKENNFYYARMLNMMCFATQKGVLMEEAKIKREEARDARYGRQEVWTPRPHLPKK